MCLDRTVPVYYNFTGNRGGWRRTSNTTFGLQSLKSKTSRILFQWEIHSIWSKESYIGGILNSEDPVDCTTSFLWHNSGVADQAPRHPLCKILTHQGIHYAGIRKIHPLCILRYFIYTVTSIIINVQRAELRCGDIGSDYSRTCTWTHRLHASITNCS